MAKSIKVLVGEDSEDDVFFMERAFESCSNLHLVKTLKDGAAIVEYLSGTGVFADRKTYPVPDLLVLDLKMPRMDGIQVLEWLRRHPFRTLKIAILSGSSYPAEHRRAQELGADFVLEKPAQLSHLVELLQGLEEQVQMHGAHA